MLEIEENRLENAKVKEGAVKCFRVKREERGKCGH